MMLKLCLLVSLFAVVYSQPFNNPPAGAKDPSKKKFSMQDVKGIIDNIFSGAFMKNGDWDSDSSSGWRQFVPPFARKFIPNKKAQGSNKQPQEAAGNNGDQVIMVGPAQEVMDQWRRK